MDDVKLLRPLPSSVGVQVHPHMNGDVVSIVFVDAATGTRHLLIADPETAHQIGQDLTTATTDPDIAEQADRVRNKQP